MQAYAEAGPHPLLPLSECILHTLLRATYAPTSFRMFRALYEASSGDFWRFYSIWGDNRVVRSKNTLVDGFVRMILKSALACDVRPWTEVDQGLGLFAQTGRSTSTSVPLMVLVADTDLVTGQGRMFPYFPTTVKIWNLVYDCAHRDMPPNTMQG